MKSDNLNLGKVIEGDAERDAIHIAVAPLVAAHKLFAGQDIGMRSNGTAATDVLKMIGIVDPFLRQPVQEGQRFWCFLYPYTITSLRHDWTHPDFEQKSTPAVVLPSSKVESEKWLRAFASQWDMDFQTMIQDAVAGETLIAHGSDIHSWDGMPREDRTLFWMNLSVYTGQVFSEHHISSTEFSCSC